MLSKNGVNDYDNDDDDVDDFLELMPYIEIAHTPDPYCYDRNLMNIFNRFMVAFRSACLRFGANFSLFLFAAIAVAAGGNIMGRSLMQSWVCLWQPQST